MPPPPPYRVRRMQISWCIIGIFLLSILALLCGVVMSSDNDQSQDCAPAMIAAGSIKIPAWQQNLTDNRTSVSYPYSVPMEWLLFYQLGHDEVDYGGETFKEAGGAGDPKNYIVNGDFTEGDGTDAYNWTEISNTSITTKWSSTGGNVSGCMWMHAGGGVSSGEGGYANQSFTYTGATPPASAYLSFDWNRTTDMGGSSRQAYLYVELKKPGANSYNILWSNNTSYADQSWIRISDLDITNNFTTAGAYDFRLRVEMEFSGGSKYADIRWDNVVLNITDVTPDTTPPASITDLTNTTYEETFINWSWTDPLDADFSAVMVYLDGSFKKNVTEQFYNATGLAHETEYEIATHTIDTSGNVNLTWINHTAWTRPLPDTTPHLRHINVTPTSCTLNISEEARFYATGYDQYNNSISGLTFRWYLNSSGIGMLNRTDGSAVNFTALHAGCTEIYAVNGNISSNKTYTVEITVNTTPGTGFVTNGTGNATAGNSTMIVYLANTSVVGTINIATIDDPLNCTDVSGNRTGLGTDVELIKGVNITVDESIAEAMATDASGSSYVHVRIGYNESELGDIDESTLHIYKFESGTGWLRMNETENPDYCSSNGRNTTANYVWANVTSCSPFVMASDGPSATSDSTPPAIQSWWNNRTGNDSLDLSVNTTEPVEFGVVFNQTGNITWNATGNPNVTNTSVNSGNQTFSWDAPGSNYLNVSITNDNGTSETLRWNITVTTLEPGPTGPDSSQTIYVNKTGWWHEGGTFNQSDTPIQSAVDNATDGSHIFVYNDSYIENVVINKPITLEGEGMDVVDVLSANIAGRVFDIESSWVNISGFTIRGRSDTGTGIYLYEVDHCNISYNNLTDNWYGIDLRKSDYNNISNNTVKDNRYGSTDSSGYGIHLYDYSGYNTIINNIVEHNGHGIGIRGSSNNNTLHTNVVNNNRQGIYVSARYNLVYNNYILFNKKFDVRDITGDNRWNITKTPGRNIIGSSHLGGNYYSEYTGSDEDGDGLGDTPFIIADKDTEDHRPLVSTIRVSERWNSKTEDSNLTLTANIGESIDFRIGYTQEGDILWKVTDQTDRENPSCDGATQTYSWSNPGTKYVDCWLTNEENGTSNKTEWVVIMSTNVKGQVKEDSGDPLVSDITYYDTDGATVLRSAPSSSTFNFTAVPLYGYFEIDAFSTKNTSVRFCISGKSTSAVITIDETKENPASFEFSEIPVKYIKMQPASLAYNNSIITIRYSEDELNGTSEGALAIYKMGSSSWQKLDTERDTENNTLTASTSTAPASGWFMVGAPAGVGVCTQLRISTDKATYLLDPYYWVYNASSEGLWQSGGYDRTVNMTVLLMDHRGYRAASDDVHYTVSNGTTIIASGDAEDRGDGLYTASFEITDADSGGINFGGSDPEYFTIRVEASTSEGIIDGTKTFRVGRWGCDRCHIEQSLAESVYWWCEPSGDNMGPHTWTNILGGKGMGDTTFDIAYLTNSELTHTPENRLNKYPWHEETKQKHKMSGGGGGGTGDPECSPCHQGSGEVRGDGSTVVECTFCHGIDGGYNANWAVSAGYAYGEHTKVDPPHDGLANQSCSNASCHGHISDSDAGEIDNAYPACADCHPISFGSSVPQWLDTGAGEPRDVGGHPSGDSPVVNCSFCHNAFHATFDESDILTCDDCHPESEDYPIHPYEGYQGNNATCANCHCNGTDHLNIHSISIPRCSDCHDSVYEDINEGYDNYAMNDDPLNLAPNGSNMTHKRDTRVALFWGSDPQGLSADGSGGTFYSRHAYPDSTGGWPPDAIGDPRNGDQICLNCHSDIVRSVGAEHDENWNTCYDKPCHNLWTDDEYGTPNVHYLSAPHCTDCHAAGLPNSWHTYDQSMSDNPPKNYARAPAIGLMLEQSIHKRLILNTTTDKPSNYLGCLICHTNASFSIDYGDFEITITEYDGVHRWNSKPACTKCHSLSDDISRPGPPAYAHDLLDGIVWGNNTQCLKCHNIYNQTADRYHGHDASTESCVGCHYNYTAMDDYGTPDVYVNETMYEASVHGNNPGDDCVMCHTNYHPPPEYTWKWCDCCHVVQPDPVIDVDRHNVTASPTTLDVTDCTECHNATSYTNSINRYGGTSADYNCRWCHTYPDQEYE